jgi:predicted alpha/beta hydrolase
MERLSDVRAYRAKANWDARLFYVNYVFLYCSSLNSWFLLLPASRQFEMKTVAEYRQFATWCRELAMKITDPKDRHAVELMAAAWEKVASDREVALKRGQEPIPGN